MPAMGGAFFHTSAGRLCLPRFDDVCMFMTTPQLDPSIAIIGAGPAGLMAAEVLSAQGYPVVVYDGMPSGGRKFLLAGRGGLNLTHSESLDTFVRRYSGFDHRVPQWLDALGPEALRTWADGLGAATFIGTSGRVFPHEMKAAPLLRAWLARLRANGVAFRMRHRWQGFDANGALQFETAGDALTLMPRACLLALGGGSWARLGSDGAWVKVLAAKGVEVAALAPANSGFDVAWSALFIDKWAGQPLKNIALSTTAEGVFRPGECMLTATGIEGGGVYALSGSLVKTCAVQGHATMYIDLLPDWSRAKVLAALSVSRGAKSWSSFLQSRLRLTGAKWGLLRERVSPDVMSSPLALTNAIKALPIVLLRARPMDEAISTSGGVMHEALDHNMMLRAIPGVFCAGEMLDWDAPTGGYLLTAVMASGVAAGHGIARYLAQ